MENQTQGVKQELILQMGTDRMIQIHVYANLSFSDSLTEVIGKMGFNLIGKRGQSATQMVPRQIKALRLGCMIKLQVRIFVSALENTPQNFRQKCMPSKHEQSRS
jgi:hypothetical protein